MNVVVGFPFDQETIKVNDGISSGRLKSFWFSLMRKYWMLGFTELSILLCCKNNFNKTKV